MKFSLNSAIAASLALHPDHVAAFLTPPNTNSGIHRNKKNGNVDTLFPAASPSSFSSAATSALRMSVSDEERVEHEERVNHIHHHQHHHHIYEENEFEEPSLISALVNNNGYSNGKNGHNGVNGVNGQSKSKGDASTTSETIATTAQVPIIDSNGVQYKLTNGQSSSSGSNGANGASANGVNGKTNGHANVIPNGKSNKKMNENNDPLSPSSIESIVEQRVMAEVELQAQQMAEQEVELQALEQKLKEQNLKDQQQVQQQQVQQQQQHGQIELQVEELEKDKDDDITNTDYTGSSSSYFGQGQVENDIGRADGGILPEDNPIAMDIIQNTTIMEGVGTGIDVSDGQTQANIQDTIHIDPLIETTKLAPTKLSSKELLTLEKVKEDEVVKNQAFHSALELKVVKEVESATERIAEECTTETVDAALDVASDGSGSGTAVTVTATATATATVTATVEVAQVSDDSPEEPVQVPEPQDQASSSSSSSIEKPSVSASASTSASTTLPEETFKPFSPLPKVKSPPKNGQYLDVLSSNRRTKKQRRRGGNKKNNIGGYLNELDGQNVKAIAGSGVGGYLDDITVHEKANTNKGRFRIPFIGRFFGRNNQVDTETVAEVQVQVPLEVEIAEEESTVELTSENDDSLTLTKTQETEAGIETETDVPTGTLSSSDIKDVVDEPLVEDDDSTSEVPEVLMSFDVTSSIAETDLEVDVEVDDTLELELEDAEEEKDLHDSLIHSYNDTSLSNIEVQVPSPSNKGDYLSELEYKTKIEEIINPKPDVVAVAQQNYLDGLNEIESTGTTTSSSGDGPSTYLTELETTNQTDTEIAKRNSNTTTNFRKKLFKLSNAVALLCFLEMKKSILLYAMPVGGITAVANLITTKNALLSSMGALGFAMMYASNIASQFLPYGRVVKRAVNYIGCALLLTSNYCSQRSENEKK